MTIVLVAAFSTSFLRILMRPAGSTQAVEQTVHVRQEVTVLPLPLPPPTQMSRV